VPRLIPSRIVIFGSQVHIRRCLDGLGRGVLRIIVCVLFDMDILNVRVGATISHPSLAIDSGLLGLHGRSFGRVDMAMIRNLITRTYDCWVEAEKRH
jgi:hypothetical protein